MVGLVLETAIQSFPSQNARASMVSPRKLAMVVGVAVYVRERRAALFGVPPDPVKPA